MVPSCKHEMSSFVLAWGDILVICWCLQVHETVQLAADNQEAAAERASLQGTTRQSAVDSQRRAASAALQHSAFYRYQQQEQDRRGGSADQGGDGRQGRSSLPWLRREPSPDRQVCGSSRSMILTHAKRPT